MIFQRTVKYPEAPMTAVLSLSHMNLNRPHIQAVIETAKSLKVKYESPICIGDAVAHVGFPKQKIAVWGNSTGSDRQALVGKRAKWKKIGWEFVSLSVSAVNDLEALRAELVDLLGLK